MRAILVAIAVVISVPAVARAQASVDIRVNLPAVLPRLVVVSPGVEVVSEVDDEVFFVDGFYWVRRGSGWYRSRSHRGGWVVVPARGVPARIAGVPPGKYRRFKPQPAGYRPGHGDRRGDDRGGHGHGHEKGHGKHGKH